METTLVSIATTHQSSIAYLVLSHLENEGIQCFLDTIFSTQDKLCSLINVKIRIDQWEVAKIAINQLSSLFPLNSIKLTA